MVSVIQKNEALEEEQKRLKQRIRELESATSDKHKTKESPQKEKALEEEQKLLQQRIRELESAASD